MEIAAKEIIPIIKGLIDKLFTSVEENLRQIVTNRLLEYQAETYRRNLFTKTFFHRSIPQSLDTFYEPLYIRKQQSTYREDQFPIIRIATENVVSFFNLSNHIVLVGNAGSGKSTLTKYLFVQCIRENFKFPIKVELRYLNEYTKVDLYDYIIEEIFTFHKLGISRDKVNELLEKNEFTFFFDGYDELSADLRIRVSRQIDAFTHRFPNNSYLVTSRPHTNIELLPTFTNYVVCDLEGNEIFNFIRKQLPTSEQEFATKIIESILNIENKIYSNYLSNPLLLAMFILNFQNYPDIPKERSIFYEQVFSTLFSEHDSRSKLAYSRKRQTDLSKQQFDELLRKFGFLSYFNNRPSFNIDYFNRTLDTIKSKTSILNFENEKVIDDLIVSIGIVIKESSNYSFPHRSLQEYFAAKYISKLSSINKMAFYKKHFHLIEINHNHIISNSNLYLLLNELDYKGLTNFLIIPLLKDVYDMITAKPSQAGIHHFYNRAYLVLRVIARLSSKSSIIKESFGLINTDYDFDESGVFIQHNFVANSVRGASFFIENYEDIINFLKEDLSIQEQAESDLIELI